MKNKELIQGILYPRAIKFTRLVGARGHIRAIYLANHNAREYRKSRGKPGWTGGRAERGRQKLGHLCRCRISYT